MDYLMPTMLTIKETAQKSGVAEHYLRQLVAARKIVFVRAGKKYLINFEKFIDFLNHGEQEQEEPKAEGIRPVAQNLRAVQ